jgi:DNA (cytosine-5)-methyltransferase 1
MPQQKPGRSEQVVATPPEFLSAVKNRLRITEFAYDLAASAENSVAPRYFDEETNALSQDWYTIEGWLWLNPPYSNIEPWVAKAAAESRFGAQIAMLVPASVGANWWRDYVRKTAYITFLNNRIKFVGHEHLYPKDLALLLYTKYLQGGDCMWRWA